MKTLLYTFAVLVVVGAAALALWWSTTTNSVAVYITNGCGRTLHNFTVTTQGQPVAFEDLTTGGGFYTGDKPRFRFDLGVSFDVGDKHFELPARTYMLPFGDSVVLLSLDPEMKLSVQSLPTFLAGR